MDRMNFPFSFPSRISYLPEISPAKKAGAIIVVRVPREIKEVIYRFGQEDKSSLPGALYHIIGWKGIWSGAAKAK